MNFVPKTEMQREMTRNSCVLISISGLPPFPKKKGTSLHLDIHSCLETHVVAHHDGHHLAQLRCHPQLPIASNFYVNLGCLGQILLVANVDDITCFKGTECRQPLNCLERCFPTPMIPYDTNVPRRNEKCPS